MTETQAGLAERYIALWNEPGADRLGDVVKLHWEAVATDGTVFAVGLSFLVLAADGRIERDYTFIVG